MYVPTQHFEDKSFIKTILKISACNLQQLKKDCQSCILIIVICTLKKYIKQLHFRYFYYDSR
jgi:hypothetical protein